MKSSSRGSLLAVLTLGALLLACGDDDGGAADAPLFTDVTEDAGLHVDPTRAQWGTYGASWADYDGDGDADVFVSLHAQAPVMFRNDGGVFTDVTAALGFDVANRDAAALNLYDRHGCAWADYDADNDPDLYCSAGAEDGRGGTPAQLFANDGTSFREVATESGVADPLGRGRGVNWLPAMGQDESLHLYVSNYLRVDAPTRLFTARLATDESSIARFEDVTLPSGITQQIEVSAAGATFTDIDGDGDADGLIAAYDGIIVERNNGDGTFTSAPGDTIGISAQNPRVVAAGDIDNDADLDLFVGNVTGASMLFENEGGAFSDVTQSWAIEATRAVSAAWEDFDNDGALDLFVVRGFDPDAGINLPDELYLNTGAAFVRSADASGAAGASDGGGDTATAADIDGDGDMDVLVTNGSNQIDEPEGPIYTPLSFADAFPEGRIIPYPEAAAGPLSLFRNDSEGNNWLAVRLVGRAPNTGAIGARVWLRSGGQQQFRELGDRVSGYAQSERVAHFGLGDLDAVDEVRIEWPDGATQTIANPEINAQLTLRQE